MWKSCERRRRTSPEGRDEARLGIEQHRDQYTASQLCRVLGVSRSGQCQWRTRPPSQRTLANQALDVKVSAVHQISHRTYGRARIVQRLRQQGEMVSAERVRKSLQRQGLRPVYRRSFVVTTDSSHCLPVADNLLDRRFDGWPGGSTGGNGWSLLRCLYFANCGNSTALLHWVGAMLYLGHCHFAIRPKRSIQAALSG